MLAQSHARKPAPPLAARGMWLRLHGGADAFGSALGDAVVGAIQRGDQQKTSTQSQAGGGNSSSQAGQSEEAAIKQMRVDAYKQKGYSEADAIDRVNQGYRLTSEGERNIEDGAGYGNYVDNKIIADAGIISGRDSVKRVYERAKNNATNGVEYTLLSVSEKVSDLTYDVVDGAMAAWGEPREGLKAVPKAIGNFGPESFNGSVNTLKTSLDGWSLLGEQAGIVAPGSLQWFRDTKPYNIDTLFKYDNSAQAFVGGATNLALGFGLEKYGDYEFRVDSVSSGGVPKSQLGGVAPIRLVKPVQPGEVTTYQDFKARSVVGDNLEGHEMWQQANIKAQGLGNTRLSGAVSKNNPVIALDAETHKAVNAAQRVIDAKAQTPIENIRANANIMRELKVAPVKVINSMERQAVKHARNNGF